MTISELQKQAHEIAKSKGWWDRENWWGRERSWEEIVCLIHSEISEAFEEYRAGRMDTWYHDIPQQGADGVVRMTGKAQKPEGFPIELADIVIRLMDYSAYKGSLLSYADDPLKVLRDKVPNQNFLWDNRPVIVSDLLACCHATLHIKRLWDYMDRIKLCFIAVQYTAEALDIDLEKAILTKMEYNRGRSYRHGGKKA